MLTNQPPDVLYFGTHVPEAVDLLTGRTNLRREDMTIDRYCAVVVAECSDRGQAALSAQRPVGDVPGADSAGVVFTFDGKDAATILGIDFDPRDAAAWGLKGRVLLDLLGLYPDAWSRRAAA